MSSILSLHDWLCIFDTTVIIYVGHPTTVALFNNTQDFHVCVSNLVPDVILSLLGVVDRTRHFPHSTVLSNRRMFKGEIAQVKGREVDVSPAVRHLSDIRWWGNVSVRRGHLASLVLLREATSFWNSVFFFQKEGASWHLSVVGKHWKNNQTNVGCELIGYQEKTIVFFLILLHSI